MTPSGPRLSRLTHEVPVVVVMLLGAIGLAFVSQGYWRRGLFIVAGASLVGAVLRLSLPARRAGLLAVRSRGVDVIFLAGFGTATMLLAAVIPASG